jgi:Tfp pilus assembly protein PilE
METHIALIAIPEIMIVLIVLGCIAWVVWAVREHKQASEIAALGQAWRDVLDDPHYMERRHFEERKRVEEDEHKRASGLLGWRRNRKNAAA